MRKCLRFAYADIFAHFSSLPLRGRRALGRSRKEKTRVRALHAPQYRTVPPPFYHQQEMDAATCCAPAVPKSSDHPVLALIIAGLATGSATGSCCRRPSAPSAVPGVIATAGARRRADRDVSRRRPGRSYAAAVRRAGHAHRRGRGAHRAIKDHGLPSNSVTAIDYRLYRHARTPTTVAACGVIAAFRCSTLYSSVTRAATARFSASCARPYRRIFITVPDVGDACPGATVRRPRPAAPQRDVNNQSLILCVDYGSNALPLHRRRRVMRARRTCSTRAKTSGCDVIKAGHRQPHSTATLLYEAQPKYAVINCGADNEYGHPQTTTLSRLRDADDRLPHGPQRHDRSPL